MSGNQYVYVVELDSKLRSNVKLVTKNRREAMSSYEGQFNRLRGEGYTVMDHFEIKPGQMHIYVRPHSRDVCIRMVRFRKQEVDVVIRVTAWVIKWAKDEFPARIGGYSTDTAGGAP
jgi:hypothetical protein